MSLAVVDFKSYETSVPLALEKIGAGNVLSTKSEILMKPNLVTTAPPPVTTSVHCCEAILQYLLAHTSAKIIIAEGTGDAGKETHEIFDTLGYTKLAKRYDVQLVDLNTEPLIKLENKNCAVFPEFYLPKIAFTYFVISIPVLKAHSLAILTGALKNMMGFAPPEHYGGKWGGWKKATFHENMQQGLKELIQYRSPDLAIMDASIGLRDYHLGGSRCNPPAGKILASFDPFSLDRKAAHLLGLDWKKIPHLVTD